MLPAPTHHPNDLQATGNATASGYTPPQVPPGIVRALRVLQSHFADLLTQHPNQWVACDGNGVLSVGTSWDGVFNGCLNQGLKPDEFVVEYLIPGALDDLDEDALRDPE